MGTALLTTLPVPAFAAQGGGQAAAQGTGQQGAGQQGAGSPAKPVSTAPPPAQSQLPAAAKPAAVPTITVRGGNHSDHSRLVFDWATAVKATIDRQAGEHGDRVTVHFDKAAKANLADLSRVKLPRVGAVTQETADGGLSVTFTVPSKAEVIESRVGDKVVLDIGNADTATSTTSPSSGGKAEAEAKGRDADKAHSGKPVPERERKREARRRAEEEAKTAKPGTDPRAAREGAPLYELRPAPEMPPGYQPVAGPSAGSTATGREHSPAARRGENASAAAVGTAFAVPGAPTPAAAEEPGPASPAVVFNPGIPAGVAIFPRAGWLYILFDRAVPPSTAPERAAVPALLGAVENVDFPGGTGFRMPMPAVAEPHAFRQGTAWRITFDRPGLVTPATTGLAVTPDTAFALGARLLVKLPESAKVMRFTDPAVGDTLSVVPLPQEGQSIHQAHRYAQAIFLETAQGIVVRSIDDRVVVQPAREGVEVAVPGGLRLSPVADTTVAAPPQQEVKPNRYFDFENWSRQGDGTFTQGRQAIMDQILAMPPDEKPRGRLAMARFYAGWGFGEEALNLLEMVRQQQPDLENRPEFLAVRGTARILTGHMQEGLADLSTPALQKEPDVGLWQAYAAHATGDDVTAYRLFQSHKDLLKTYPEPFNTRFSLAATEAALANHDTAAATATLDRLTRRGADKGNAGTAVDFLKGEAQRLAGDDAKALEFYHAAAQGPDRLYRTKARLAQIEEEAKLGKLTPKQTAEEMEKLRFAWTGDALELKILRDVADAHLKAGEYPQAFDTMKRALTLYPDSPDAPAITKQMTDAFVGLFVNNGASKIPPLEALSLYEQYKELTPPGPDGDKVIRVLAERLVDVDLLDRAAELLDHQVTYRLQGEEKGRVGAREAAIRLLNGQPDQAIAALDKSEVPNPPADLAEERRLLRARALSKMDKGAQAVALLQPDQTRPANLLRIDIAWHAKQWPAAAQALAEVIGPPPAAGQPLAPGVSTLVVNRAVALALAQDMAGLQKLRADFGAAMDKTPDADMFKVVTRPQEATGLLDAATIQAQVKEIDLFKDFLDAYRKDKDVTPAGEPTPPAGPPPNPAPNPGAPAPATPGK